MRKSFALLLALVLLVSGTGVYTQASILKEKDQVHSTEVLSYGDKSVVDGVQVEMYSYYDNQIFWHTTYEFGAEEKEKTDYEFYPWYHERETSFAGSLETLMDYMPLWVGEVMEDKEYSGLQAAMKELYDKTPNGKENQMIVYLKDYAEYYTFGLDFSFPREEGKTYKDYDGIMLLYPERLNEDIAYYEETAADSEHLKMLKKVKKDWDNFNEFFKIPVIEKEIYGLSLVKDEAGRITGMGTSNVNGGSSTGDVDNPGIYNIEGLDGFALWFNAVYDNGDCYLTFDPHTHNGNLVDTSQIPGEFGIYRVAYDNQKGTIDSEHIQMVYALNPEDKIGSLKIDASGENLLLETIEKNRTYLSVINRDTMELVQKIDMGDSSNYFSYDNYEEYMVIRSDELAVYTKDTTGLYQKKFEVEIAYMEEQLGLGENESVGFSGIHDWNGETLLIASNYWKKELGIICGFSLMAVNENGIAYYGEYESSLVTDDEEYNRCYPDHYKENPVLVHWGK